MTVKLMNDEPETQDIKSPTLSPTLWGSLTSAFKINIDDSRQPVGDITVQDAGTLDPKPDITPLESVMLTRMLIIAVASHGGFRSIDYKGFIEQHGLTRHFRK